MAQNCVVKKSPQEDLSFKNRAVMRSLPSGEQYVRVTKGDKKLIFGVAESSKISPGELGLHVLQRSALDAVPGTTQVKVEPFPISRTTQNLIGILSVELDYYEKPKKPQPATSTEELAEYFREQFMDNVFMDKTYNKSQEFQFLIGKYKPVYLKAKILSMQVDQLTGDKEKSKGYGIFHANTRLVFEKKPGSIVQLIGKYVGDSAHQALISPDWDFNKMGIGGLDKEFSDIFRRAFASRVFPPDVVEQLNMKHVRGILLYGPPGTGKTLMARKIGEMLHAREPKVVNGPEILNKYVGESEAKVRELFKEAEKEQVQLKSASALHIIIFDEIDAICRTRGSLSGSTGVHDTVVNQLLSKMDGVEQLNNILVIGMTNRKDMIDEALLRPGRLEVHMEISLPDEHGRLQIIRIHTAELRKTKRLGDDVSLEELAKSTKNFSGAEIEGLVRSATSTAMNKLIKAGDQVMVSRKEAESLKVTLEDFDHALNYDVKPAFGTSEDQLNHFVYNGIIPWSSKVQDILDRGADAVTTVLKSQCAPLMSVLLHGPPDTGKTALAAYIAKSSDITFVKIISPEDMVGFSESAKCNAIRKVFDDAYKSEVSCIVIDDIERLLDYVVMGPRFSNLVLQSLLVLLRKIPPVTGTNKKAHRLLILGTTSLGSEVLSDFGFNKAFKTLVGVPYIRHGQDICQVLEESKMFRFSETEIDAIKNALKKAKCKVGIKKLLDILEAAYQSSNRVDSLMDLLRMEAELQD